MPGFHGPLASLSSIERKLGRVRVHTQTGYFTALQLTLHIQPIFNAQKVGILLPKTPPCQKAGELHAVLEFFRKKDHAVLEKPAWNIVFAGFTIRVRADLDLGQLFDGVVIEQKY